MWKFSTIALLVVILVSYLNDSDGKALSASLSMLSGRPAPSACGAPGEMRYVGGEVQACNGGSWDAINIGPPAGTICGLQTNGDTFGPRCKGYAPYDSQCPPGWTVNIWTVSFGSGLLAFCSKN